MQELKQLLSALGSALDAPDRERVLATSALAMDGVPVTLNPAGDADPAGVHAYYALGRLPEADRDAAALRMLQLNLCLFGRDAPQFGLDASSGQAVMMVRIDISELTATDLHQALSTYATLAGAWQDTRFADGVLQPGLADIRRQFLAQAWQPRVVGAN